MKKKILIGFAVLSIAAVAAWNVNLNAQKSDLSDLALANVEALAQENGGTGNTGPAQVVDCAGWGTGSKKVCLCSNSYSCTESSCS